MVPAMFVYHPKMEIRDKYGQFDRKHTNENPVHDTKLIGLYNGLMGVGR